MFETGVQMRLQPQVHNDRVMMTVDVGVDAVQSLEQLFDGALEMFRKRCANAGGEDGFVVNEGLGPGHEVLDVFWGRHFGGFGVASWGVLPEILEP